MMKSNETFGLSSVVAMLALINCVITCTPSQEMAAVDESIEVETEKRKLD